MAKPANSISVYYFQYKQRSSQRGIVGRLSETEIFNLLPRVIAAATPEIYPPGSILWHSGELTPQEMENCRWMTFLTQVDKLEWTEGRDWPVDELAATTNTLRQDYDAFQAFLETAMHQTIFSLDKDWVSTIAPQVFDYQSPARQSPYLIRAMINLSYDGDAIGCVLDPMGGYGQTLFECVLRGIDGATLEISPTASQRSAENLRKLLQRLQIPFEESQAGNCHLFVTQGTTQNRYQIVNGDTRKADEYLPNQQFDSLMTDFPYGVRAGSRTDKLVPTDYDRLLDAALPSWKRLLKPHGTIVMAYNLYTLPRETVRALIRRHGFRQRFAAVDLSGWISDKIHRDIVAFEKMTLPS
ncbi:MAG: hypothetical protein O7E52_24465 [Candidatus Poribacteria bacterium]|nr:hypothetical protein [Candidatus Poribacteria bacterium]